MHLLVPNIGLPRSKHFYGRHSVVQNRFGLALYVDIDNILRVGRDLIASVSMVESLWQALFTHGG